MASRVHGGNTHFFLRCLSNFLSILATLVFRYKKDHLGKPVKKVMVLYPGGTIGMEKKNGVFAPSPNFLPSVLRKTPTLHNPELCKEMFGQAKDAPFIIDNGAELIVYWIVEYSALLDSSDMGPDDWISIAKDIGAVLANPVNFDGFVVLHGTDTLAYTASALSFMLENLDRPVVITGSQISLSETRSDAQSNIIGSIVAAATLKIPEVVVCFNNCLYRGNRTVKVNCRDFLAFESPNFPPLARLDVGIEENRLLYLPASNSHTLNVHANLNRRVAILKIDPLLDITVRAILAFADGIVLEGYGAGNIPTNRPEIIEALKKAVTIDGKFIINVTQCIAGRVASIYEAGNQLAEEVIPGEDISTVAAFVKLCYVLGKTEDRNERTRMLRNPLRGEMTIH